MIGGVYLPILEWVKISNKFLFFTFWKLVWDVLCFVVSLDYLFVLFCCGNLCLFVRWMHLGVFGFMKFLLVIVCFVTFFLLVLVFSLSHVFMSFMIFLLVGLRGVLRWFVFTFFIFSAVCIFFKMTNFIKILVCFAGLSCTMPD